MPEQSSQSKYVQNLATYPALTALAGLVASFPIVKIFASNAVPLLQSLYAKSEEEQPQYDHNLDLARDADLLLEDEEDPSDAIHDL